ncbi:MAG: RluA family pseudouridine synthase [Endomicrobiia bacterium]
MLKGIDIIFEDEDFLFINKPSGLLSIPDRFDKKQQNLYTILKECYNKIFVVHRLDKETSGIICFAKNAETHRELNTLFETRKIKKSYLALVDGKVENDCGIIDIPIELNSKIFKLSKSNIVSKDSITEYKLLEKFKNYSLLEVFPKTGRTHQIRIHLSSIGHPLAIDSLYGRRDKIYLSKIKPNYKFSGKEKPLMNRLTLHSYKIEFFYSKKNKLLTFTAPLPENFQILLKQLRRYNSELLNTEVGI